MSTIFINRAGEATHQNPNGSYGQAQTPDTHMHNVYDEQKREALLRIAGEEKFQSFSNFVRALHNAHQTQLWSSHVQQQDLHIVMDAYIRASERICVIQTSQEEPRYSVFAVTRHGHIFVDQEKIEFRSQPENNAPFTMRDAQLMAWQAAQNKSFSGPDNKINVNGTPEQRRMIAIAIKEQNKYLPADQKLTINNPLKFSLPTLRKEKADFIAFMGTPAPAGTYKNPAPAQAPNSSDASRNRPSTSSPETHHLGTDFKSASAPMTLNEKRAIVKSFKDQEVYTHYNGESYALRVLGTIEEQNSVHVAGVTYNGGKPFNIPFESLDFKNLPPGKQAEPSPQEPALDLA